MAGRSAVRSLSGPAKPAGTHEPTAVIDKSKLNGAIAQAPVSSIGLFTCNRFAHQHFADEDELTAPFDLTIAADPPNQTGIGIIGFTKPSAIAPQRGRIVPRRRGLLQCFVGTLFVIKGSERIEAALLGTMVRGWRAGGLALEREVEALMASVLLRLSWLDPLWDNPCLDQTHRQLRKPTSGSAGKRGTVVAAHRLGQSELPESGIEYRPNEDPGRTLHRLTAQQISAVPIAQGQRIAALAIGRAEPALEVHAPYIVGRKTTMERSAWRNTTPTFAPDRQPTLVEQLSHRACRRPIT